MPVVFRRLLVILLAAAILQVRADYPDSDWDYNGAFCESVRNEIYDIHDQAESTSPNAMDYQFAVRDVIEQRTMFFGKSIDELDPEFGDHIQRTMPTCFRGSSGRSRDDFSLAMIITPKIFEHISAVQVSRPARAQIMLSPDEIATRTLPSPNENKVVTESRATSDVPDSASVTRPSQKAAESFVQPNVVAKPLEVSAGVPARPKTWQWPWIIVGFLGFISLCIWLSFLHRDGALTMYSNWTDLGFAASGPIVFVGSWLVLQKFGTDPTAAAKFGLVAGIAFWLLPIRDALRQNTGVYLPMVVVTKLVIPTAFVGALATAYVLNALWHSAGKRTNEHPQTRMKRQRDLDARSKIVWVGALAGMTGWLASIAREQRFAGIGTYVRGEHLLAGMNR